MVSEVSGDKVVLLSGLWLDRSTLWRALTLWGDGKQKGNQGGARAKCSPRYISPVTCFL